MGFELWNPKPLYASLADWHLMTDINLSPIPICYTFPADLSLSLFDGLGQIAQLNLTMSASLVCQRVLQLTLDLICFGFNTAGTNADMLRHFGTVDISDLRYFDTHSAYSESVRGSQVIQLTADIQ